MGGKQACRNRGEGITCRAVKKIFLSNIAADSARLFNVHPSTTPFRLRMARTCYDHMAGTVAVGLHDDMTQDRWLDPLAQNGSDYQLSAEGAAALERLGLDVETAGRARRRFACACLDWSERRPHLGGALGATMLALLLRQGWIARDLDSRALCITHEGRRRFKRVFNLDA